MIADSLENWFLSSIPSCSKKPIEIDVELLEKITIIVPSYNRQEYLLRLMLYWSNTPAQVIIVDGSTQPLGKNILAVLVSHPNIKYIHNVERIENRLALAAQLIETPYAVMSGDDEFHLKWGLCSAIKALESDPILVGCIGQSISFGFKADARQLQFGKGYPHYNYSVLQEEIGSRLTTAMSEYNAATCYAVMRKCSWIRSWGNLQAWSSPYAGELQQALIICILGRFTTVNEVYWMRSFEAPPISIKGISDRRLSFYDWWATDKYRAERDDFIDFLTNEVMLQVDMVKSDARQMIIEAIKVYLDWWSKETMQSRNLSQKLRSFAAKTARRFLSDERIDKLKALLGIPVDVQVTAEFDLGTLAELIDADTSGLFIFNEELKIGLSEIQALIADFYEARGLEIGRTEVTT